MMNAAVANLVEKNLCHKSFFAASQVLAGKAERNQMKVGSYQNLVYNNNDNNDNDNNNINNCSNRNRQLMK